MNLKTEITKIHYNKDAKGLLVKLLDFASLFYGIGSGFKNFLYDKNILKPKKVDAFVISVGNLTTGGVGKTPVVAEIAKYLINKGEKVAIVSRGYGGKLSNKNINVISDGEKVYYDAQMAGDEPFWLAENAARQLGSQAAKSGQAPSLDGERICGRTERSESGLRKDGAYCGEATNAELLEQRANSRQGWDGVISTVNSENSQEQHTDTVLSPYCPTAISPNHNSPHPNPPHPGREQCQSAIVITSKNRYNASKYAIEHFGATYIILDDGFQHRKLHRDLDIVLADSEKMFGREKLLPAGPLREGFEAFKRIDKLVIVSKNTDHTRAEKLAKIMGKKMNVPPFVCKTEPDIVYNIKTGEILPKDAEVTAICAIGQPEQFYAFLKDYKIKETVTFDDHHKYEENEIPEGTIITTEKDAVKMKDFSRNDIYALKLKTVIDVEGLIG